MKRNAILFLLFCISIPAWGLTSQEWNFAEPYMSKCSMSNQMDNNACLSDEFHTIDKQLNERYNFVVNALAEPKYLVSAQRAWLKFRDAQCIFELGGPNYSGSLGPFINYSCLINLTLKRILDLKAIRPCNGCVLFKDKYYEDGAWPSD